MTPGYAPGDQTADGRWATYSELPSTGTSPMSMISAGPSGAADAGRVEVGEGGARREGGVHRGLLRAPQLVLFGDRWIARVRPVEAVALVADDGENLGVGEIAAGVGSLGRHHPNRVGLVGASLTVRIAVDRDPGKVVALRAEVHEAQLVLDVRERLVHLAVGQRPSATSFAGSAVARRAVAEDLGADAHRPLDGLLGGGQRADVHERPDRHQ